MWYFVNSSPVSLKNFGQPMRSIHSPIRSKGRAFFAYTSTRFFTASVTSGQRGGLFGRYGIASLENIGSCRALETLPPTQIEMPSFSGSAMVIDGQTVKQLPQNMHCSSMTVTDCFPSTIAGRTAPVGQAATVLGASHCFITRSWLILGGFRCTASTAMSEQCTAPHMLRQQ